MSDQLDLNFVHQNLSSINENTTECSICLHNKDVTVVFDCQHHLCLSCFKQYAINKLNRRQFKYDPNIGYTIACPSACPNSLLTELHIFRLMDKINYERYKIFAAEEYVFYHNGVLCPTASCGAGLIPAVNSTKVLCPLPLGCGKVFCRNCKNFWTDPTSDVCSCQNIHRVEQEHPAYSFWRRVFGPTTNSSVLRIKKCPTCRVYTEKDGGCNEISCVRCGLNWCWICEKEFRSDCIQYHWF